MSVISITTDVAGQIAVQPRRVAIISSDNLATVTAAGYLNTSNLLGYTLQPTDEICMWYGYVSSASPGTFGIFNPVFSNGVITLNIWENPGNVLLPVVDGDFANFNGTSGQIEDAGYSPSDAAKTKVVMAGSAVQVGYLAHFIDVNGTVDDTAGAVINAGNIQAGLINTAGGFISFPAGASSGSLVYQAVANGGVFNVTVSNASHGQSTVHSIPDPANAVARFLVGATATPFVSGEFPVASGTGGLMVSSGLAAANVQNKTNIIANRTANIGGGGAGPISVVVAGLTAASIVTASIQASSNTVSVSKVTATATGFDILFSADPGATCTVNYHAFVVAQ